MEVSTIRVCGDEWMKVKLKDLGKISTGNTPSKKIPEFYDSKDIGFVKPDIISEFQIDYIENTTEYLAEAARNKARIVKKNAVFVTCIGSIGKIGIVKNKELAFNQQINAIEPNEKVLPKYLAYGIFANKRRLQTISNAPVVPIINKTQFGEFEIDIINDIKVQLKVVELLDKVSELIANRKEELIKLDELIQARFVEMFGNPFATSKWTVKKLKDISESMVDGSNVNPDYYEPEGEVLFLRIQNVWRNEFRLDDSVYIAQEINKNQYYDTSLRTGDLLITKIGRYYTKDSSLGRVSVYRGDDDCANYSNNIMRVRLDSSVNSEFVNVLLNLEDYQFFIKRTSKGGTDKRALSKSLIGSYPIILPPKELQDEFVGFVKRIDKSKSAIKKSLEKTQLLFDSLMQKYFG